MKRYRKTSQPLPWPLSVVFMLFVLAQIFEVGIALYWFAVVAVITFVIDLFLRKQRSEKQDKITRISDATSKKVDSEYDFDPEDYKV